jgi:predicted  nucleic acid-binding Zn-ribbon protein
MAEVDGNLIYEMLKRIQADVSALKEGQRDLRNDNLSLRNQFHTMQGDMNGLRGSIAHIEDRLDRIENRLELQEFSERGQRPFDPSS